MKHWTKKEEDRLARLVELHRNELTGRIAWSYIAPHFDRTLESLKNRYHTKLTKKPKGVTRSFLWGLYTVTRKQ